MTYLSAFLLGLIQGVAEFLPISSSGHLAIAEHLLGMVLVGWGSVLLGGAVGAILAVANFFLMANGAMMAADKAQQQDVEGGQKLMKSAYPIRILVLAALLELMSLLS